MTEILRGQAANVITVIRILLTYWMNRIIWSSGEEISFYLLFVFAVVIGATDWLDGKVARWLNIESEIGGHLDKLADKYYACSLFIYFLQKEIFSWNFDQITLSLINIFD